MMIKPCHSFIAVHIEILTNGLHLFGDIFDPHGII